MNTPLGAIISKLGDGRSNTHMFASTAAMTALALINPRRLTPGKRAAYRTAVAGLTGWMAWAAMNEQSSQTSVAPEVKVGVTTAAAGIALGGADLGETLDGKIHDALLKRGATRPRLWMAAATAVLNLAVLTLDRKSDAWLAQPDTLDNGEYDELEGLEATLVDLPDDVRALIETLLDATESFGAAELRTQLERAKLEEWVGEDESSFYPGAGLHTDPDLALAVPGNGNFPVIGRFRALDGLTFDVYLTLQEGRLASLSISEAADWTEDAMIEWFEAGRSVQELDGWPHPDELELLIETPEGYRPVR